MIYTSFIVFLIAYTANAQTVSTMDPLSDPLTLRPNLAHIGMKTGGLFLASASNSPNSEACTSRYSCVNCTAARICAPLADDKGFQEVRRFNCTTTTPYCDYETGTCTSTQTQQCASQGDFICLRDGYFPDPTTCTKFHYCHNSKSYTFNCLQSYYYYDSKSESCVYNKGCYSFSCSGKNGYKVTYPADPSIYAYCVGNTPYVVDRCLGKDELNTTSQKCEPVCRKEGLLEDTDDCTSYYKCSIESQVSSTVTYSMTHDTCRFGQAYSPIAFQCVPVAQVPGCYVQPAGNSTTTLTPV